MAWTTPRTWVAAEIVTASVMNVHVRDNLAYLKGILDGTVAGNLIVTGNITASGSVQGNIGGSFVDLTVSDDATILSDLAVSGNTTLSGQLLLGNPTPSIVWVGDLDTYIEHASANRIGLVTGGVAVADFYATGVDLWKALTVHDNIASTGVLTVTPPAGGGSSSGIDTSGNLYTQAGGLNVVGNTALTGTLTVGGQPVRSAGARVRRTTTQSLTTAVAAAIAFDAERYDTTAFHDTASNTSRFTIPSGMAGKYLITGCVEFANNATGVRALSIRHNVGGTLLAAVNTPAISGDTTILTIATIYDLAVGDYVELFAYQTSGGALTTLASGNYSPEFTIMAIG